MSDEDKTAQGADGPTDSMPARSENSGSIGENITHDAPVGGDGVPANEIGVVDEPQHYRDREAANADDASAIRARQTPVANEASAAEVPETPEQPIDEATRERLKTARETDRKRAEGALKRGSGKDKDDERSEDVAVRPAAGAGKALDPKSADNTIRPKPVTEKTGYEVPKSVRDRYVAFEGKYLDRKSETVHFEDKGRSLTTASEDREVIQHMVAVAQAKNWGELQLKGSEEFRRQAWISAELAGMRTRGFRPDAQDRAKLEAAREAMRMAPGERSNTSDPAHTNTVEPATVEHPSQERQSPQETTAARDAGPGSAAASAAPDREATPPEPQGAAAGPRRPSAAADGQQATDTQSVKEGQAASVEQQASISPGVTAGVLVAHGAAPFNHDEKQNASYYATVRTDTGERTVWGLDLERAIGESGVQPGQRIELEKDGSRQVTARQRQFDGKGNEQAPKPVASRRNEWVVYSPDVLGLPTRAQRQAMAGVRREADEKRQIDAAREAFLNGRWQYTKDQRATIEMARERIKEQAAREVLEEQIKGLPPQQQERARGEFESVVAAARATNRPLDLPMPQVSEATIEAVREQIERERAAQGLAPTPQRAQPGDEAVPGRTTQEAGHDAPSFELEP